jgi:arsenite-transporting ATPase
VLLNAGAISLGMARKSTKVHLTAIDFAADIKFVIQESNEITVSKIDEEVELVTIQRRGYQS